MNKKLVTTTLILLCLYVLAYFIFEQFSQTSRINSNLPQSFSIHSICEDTDRAIAILNEGSTLCESSTSIYIRAQGKSKKIRDSDTNKTYMMSSLNTLVATQENKVHIEIITNTMEVIPIQTITLPNNSRPITAFYALNLQKEVVIFLSVELLAESPNDYKSKIYEITLQKTTEGHKTIVREYNSKEMLRVSNYYSHSSLVVFQELFPFLQPKFRLINWEKDPSTIPIPCTIHTTDTFQKNPTFTTSDCDKFPDAKSITYDPSMDKFIESTQSTNESDALVPPESSELVAKYSTIIEKRVYNCFDFSESLQITLRTCLPEL